MTHLGGLGLRIRPQPIRAPSTTPTGRRDRAFEIFRAARRREFRPIRPSAPTRRRRDSTINPVRLRRLSNADLVREITESNNSLNVGRSQTELRARGVNPTEQVRLVAERVARTRRVTPVADVIPTAAPVRAPAPGEAITARQRAGIERARRELFTGGVTRQPTIFGTTVTRRRVERVSPLGLQPTRREDILRARVTPLRERIARPTQLADVLRPGLFETVSGRFRRLRPELRPRPTIRPELFAPIPSIGFDVAVTPARARALETRLTEAARLSATTPFAGRVRRLRQITSPLRQAEAFLAPSRQAARFGTRRPRRPSVLRLEEAVARTAPEIRRTERELALASGALVAGVPILLTQPALVAAAARPFAAGEIISRGIGRVATRRLSVEQRRQLRSSRSVEALRAGREAVSTRGRIRGFAEETVIPAVVAGVVAPRTERQVEATFREGVRESLRMSGLRGTRLQSQTALLSGQRQLRLTQEALSFIGISGAVERLGRGAVTRQLVRARTTRTPFRTTFVTTAPTFAGLGAIEAAAQTRAAQVARRERFRIEPIVAAAPFGALAAGTLGPTIAGAAVAGGVTEQFTGFARRAGVPVARRAAITRVGRGLETGVSIVDPSELLGDVTADILGTGRRLIGGTEITPGATLGRRAVRFSEVVAPPLADPFARLRRRTTRRARRARAGVPVVTGVPAIIGAPTETFLPSEARSFIGVTPPVPAPTPIPTPVTLPISLPVPVRAPILAPVVTPTPLPRALQPGFFTPTPSPTPLPTPVQIPIPVVTPQQFPPFLFIPGGGAVAADLRRRRRGRFNRFTQTAFVGTGRRVRVGRNALLSGIEARQFL